MLVISSKATAAAAPTTLSQKESLDPVEGPDYFSYRVGGKKALASASASKSGVPATDVGLCDSAGLGSYR